MSYARKEQISNSDIWEIPTEMWQTLLDFECQKQRNDHEMAQCIQIYKIKFPGS